MSYWYFYDYFVQIQYYNQNISTNFNMYLVTGCHKYYPNDFSPVTANFH